MGKLVAGGTLVLPLQVKVEQLPHLPPPGVVDVLHNGLVQVQPEHGYFTEQFPHLPPPGVVDVLYNGLVRVQSNMGD